MRVTEATAKVMRMKSPKKLKQIGCWCKIHDCKMRLSSKGCTYHFVGYKGKYEFCYGKGFVKQIDYAQISRNRDKKHNTTPIEEDVYKL